MARIVGIAPMLVKRLMILFGRRAIFFAAAAAYVFMFAVASGHEHADTAGTSSDQCSVCVFVHGNDVDKSPPAIALINPAYSAQSTIAARLSSTFVCLQVSPNPVRGPPLTL